MGGVLSSSRDHPSQLANKNPRSRDEISARPHEHSRADSEEPALLHAESETHKAANLSITCIRNFSTQLTRRLEKDLAAIGLQAY